MAGSALWADAPQPQRYADLTKTYCVTCHNDKAKTGGLSLQAADLENVPKAAETWEKVIRKIRRRDAAARRAAAGQSRAGRVRSFLETSLDRAADGQAESRRRRPCIA